MDLYKQRLHVRFSIVNPKLREGPAINPNFLIELIFFIRQFKHDESQSLSLDFEFAEYRLTTSPLVRFDRCTDSLWV